MLIISNKEPEVVVKTVFKSLEDSGLSKKVLVKQFKMVNFYVIRYIRY